MTQTTDNLCPKCGAPLSEVTTTSTGRELQRCSKGSWDPQLKKVIVCDYVKWLEIKPVTLDEKCPKCGEKLVLYTTTRGKKMKKCSTSSWDKEKKQATGCDYIEWINNYPSSVDTGEEFLP